MIRELKDIQKLIDEGRIHRAIEILTDYVGEHNIHGLRDSIEETQRDYDMMLQFMQQGFVDPKRSELLSGIKQRLSQAVSNAEILTELPKYHFYTSQVKHLDAADMTIENIRHQLENYVTDTAMAFLELRDESLELRDSGKSGVESLNREHHKFMSLLFVKICCSKMWTRQEAKDYADVCTSPTIDQRDQQLIVSAITLGCMRFFDKEKWTALSDIYTRTLDDGVKQRALVGWVMTLLGRGVKDEKIEKRLREMFLDEATLDAVTQMQIEMLFCSNAEKDRDVIDNEIVPGIIKNSNYRVTPHGLEEIERDELEEVLHPEKEDEQQDAVMQYYERIQKMQKNGSDVYFGGLSQMKRYAFFYNLSNWFVPFYPEHPDVVAALKNKENTPQILKIVEVLPMCNSDRYSFLLGVSSVIDSLPKDVAKMLRSGEIAESRIEKLESEAGKRTRLLYLQDIYRYAKLFPEEKMLDDKIFRSVFTNEEILFNAGLEKRAISILRTVHKTGFNDVLDTMLRNLLFWGSDKDDFILINAKRLVEQKDYRQAFLNYVVVELKSGGKISLMKATAKAAMLAGFYKDAAKRYEILAKREPENVSHKLNYCYAMVCDGEAKTVVDDLFRIEFEAFESGNDKLSMNARRVLALALFSAGRHDESLKRYRKIADSEDSTLADLHGLGLTLCIDGKAKEGIPILTDYCKKYAENTKTSFVDALEAMYKADLPHLKIYNADFTEDDLRLLREIIEKTA